jgi:chromosome segregation ATPase
VSAPATAADALQRAAIQLAEVRQRLTTARARLADLPCEPSHETRVRLRREIEPEIVIMEREIEDLDARQADLRRVLLRETIATKRDDLASAKARRVKKDAVLADAVARLQKASDEQNADARAEHEIELELQALERELAVADAPPSPAKIVQEATRARVLALATPAPIVGGSAPVSGEP